MVQSSILIFTTPRKQLSAYIQIIQFFIILNKNCKVVHQPYLTYVTSFRHRMQEGVAIMKVSDEYLPLHHQNN